MAKTQQNQNEETTHTTGKPGVTYLKPGMLASPQIMRIESASSGNFGKTDLQGVIGGRPTIVSVSPKNPQHAVLAKAFGSSDPAAWVGKSIRVSDDTVWVALNVEPVA